MKKLKFDHELAELIQSGKKWSTWRLFDDKDLSVNDRVTLIDKAQPEKPETWRPIGSGTITKIIEKRLGDITDNDMHGHEPFASREAMFAKYRQYYGSNVTADTPVKMISFTFSPSTETSVDEVPSLQVKLYADGGSRGNPGPSASGYVLLDEKGEVLVDKGVYLGVTTNNQAEYQALKLGLEEAKSMHARHVDVYMDSMLVVNQMKGIFKVKNRDLWPIHESIKQLTTSFEKVTFTHIPRELNKLADTAVNRALDEQVGKPSKKLP